MSDEIGGGSSMRDAWSSVRALVEVPAAEFEALIDVLNRPVISFGEIRSEIAIAAPSVSEEHVRESVGAIVGYVGAWMRAGSPAEPRLEDNAVQRVYATGEGSESARRRVVRLVTSKTFMLAASAFHAAQANGALVEDISVFMNVAPLEGVGPLGSAVFPLFKLTVETFNGNSGAAEGKVSHILDISDLRDLKKSLDRAFEQMEELEKFYASRDILTWGSKEEGSDE